MKKSTRIVDVNSPTANMYGCEPCPKCKSVTRCVFNDRPTIIQCDDCGSEEEIDMPDQCGAIELTPPPKKKCCFKGCANKRV